MKSKILILFLILIFCLAIVIIGLNLKNIKAPCNELKLPGGYTCNNYEIIDVLEGTTCDNYAECTNKLPLEYAVMSNCPYQAICLADKCTVVCPSHK